jgi:hypothetical protein
VVIFGFAGSNAVADSYINNCDDPANDINGHLCVTLAERIEHQTDAAETLDGDIQWVVYSISLLTGFAATTYGLHAMRRSVFGRTVSNV